MLAALNPFGEGEEEMRQCRLSILMKDMGKCKTKHLDETSEEMINYRRSDPGCIPREVNVILISSTASFEPHAQHNSQGEDALACSENKCLYLDDVPHLIGVVDEEDDEDSPS